MSECGCHTEESAKAMRYMATVELGKAIKEHWEEKKILESQLRASEERAASLQEENERLKTDKKIDFKTMELLTAERDRLRAALELATETLADIIAQEGFYPDGKPSYFNTKFGWSEGLAKAQEALSGAGTEGKL